MRRHRLATFLHWLIISITTAQHQMKVKNIFFSNTFSFLETGSCGCWWWWVQILMLCCRGGNLFAVKLELSQSQSNKVFIPLPRSYFVLFCCCRLYKCYNAPLVVYSFAFLHKMQQYHIRQSRSLIWQQSNATECNLTQNTQLVRVYSSPQTSL